MEGSSIDNKVQDAVNKQRPFLGLSSYEEKNKLQFGGRDNEIKELFDLVEKNGLTIVFGKSGIGKTSLIKAGLIPELQKNFYFPIYVRIDFLSSISPLNQLKVLIYNSLKVFDTKAPEINGVSLWKYFHDLQLKEGIVIPVLILDQFEEIFTLGQNEREEISEFITELSDLCENRVPLAVQEQYKDRSDVNFSYHSRQSYRVILSLREDYLAQVESFKTYLPSLKNSRFRVIQMTIEQALDAVIKPANGLIETRAASEIIRKLPGISERDFDSLLNRESDSKKFVVEPFLLSLICYQVNEKRIEKELEKISLELVSQFDITDVITSFYNNTIKSFDENVQRGIEDTLLTEAGFRKLESLEELIFKYAITNKDIQQLIDKRIVRKELRNGVEYVELIHDVLAPIIKQKRDERIKAQHEKEKNETVRLAIIQYRTKRRNVIKTALFVLVPIIIFIGYSYYKNAVNANRFENIAFAQRLLLTSQNLAVNNADYQVAALISRVAFLINKENKGENDDMFYNSMHTRLNDLNYNFAFAIPDTSQIRVIATPDNDIFYIGYEDGKIFKQSLADSTAQLFCDLKEKITSIATSPDKKYMAVSGIFDSVYFFDLSRKVPASIALFTNDTVGNGKSVCFTNDGKLILRLDSSIMEWEVNSTQPIIWNKRKEVTLVKTEAITASNTIEWNKTYLEYQPKVAFNCLSAFKDKIAVGMDSSLILIIKDSLIKIKSNDLGITSSITFDPGSNYLYIGNNIGSICRMSLHNYQMEFNQNQSTRIYNIVCSSDGIYVASASLDGSVVICNTQKEWGSLNVLRLFLSKTEANAYGLAFGKSNEYILAGYSNGHVYKWPVSSQILAQLICQNVTNASFDTTIWRKYLSSYISFRKMKNYECNSSNNY